MAVYVDDMFRYSVGRFGRMKMSHLFADSMEELHTMAAKIGIARRHFQGDHYDICMSKRAQAIHEGATRVTLRHMSQLVAAHRRKRAA